MQVTVNLSNEEQGATVEVQAPFTIEDANGNSVTTYITLGEFTNGTSTEVDDILVTQFGATPVDLVIGDPLPAPSAPPAPPVTSAPAAQGTIGSQGPQGAQTTTTEGAQ